MSAAAHSAAPDRRPDFLRWRRRSRLIRTLKIVLPILIGLIFATLAGFVARGTLTGEAARNDEAEAPIRLVNFRLVGRDSQGRAFVLTANSAVRDRNDYRLVHLDKPTLVIDAESPTPTRLAAGSGELHEEAGQLELRGGVELESERMSIATAQSSFDTTTGVLSGEGDIAGRTPLGEVTAKSYGVYDEGRRMIFKGGVRGRIESK